MLHFYNPSQYSISIPPEIVRKSNGTLGRKEFNKQNLKAIPKYLMYEAFITFSGIGTQLTFTLSNSTIETLEKGVKYV